MSTMRLVLAVLVLCACGGARPVAVANRGGTASTSCELPARLDFEARRYANVDADDPGFHTWSAWRVGIQLRDARGTLAMVGDELTWTFDVDARLDRERCTLHLVARTHDPFWIHVDLGTRTGKIRSIDDEWLLGPPFPTTR